MPGKDYYKILGVTKSASKEKIRKAYRKLAMKHHPDHAKGDKGAEERFKEISEAYAVLSDPEKRKQYDTFGSADFNQRFSQEDIFRGFDFSDILKDFGFSGFNFGGGGRNGMKFSFGPEGPFGGQARQQERQVKGPDLVYELGLTLVEVASGTRKNIRFQHKGKNENLTVTIPRGMISGKKIRLAGKGEESPYGGPTGDLFIQSKVVEDPVYRAEGYDLHMSREIRLSEAILGTTLSIPTLEGKESKLKIPPGTKHKTKMRLAKRGLPHMKSKKKGDLFIQILIQIPKQLSKEQQELVHKLAETGL